MHTVICAFHTHEDAREAISALKLAGFQDVHEEHRFSHAGGAPNDRWDGMEREVAVDRDVLAALGDFFSRLLGRDDAADRADDYAKHVERGGHVVVVDAPDEEEAGRAGDLLRELRAGKLHVWQRAEQRPLREIVGLRQAGTGSRSNDVLEPTSTPGVAASERDRAMASSRVSPTTGPDLRDPEAERAPGLRYADKDKPL